METLLLFWVVAFVAIYVFTAVCFQKIAERTNTEDAWWAWVPILNILLMLKIAEKPMWWIILLFIPLVNFIIAILVLLRICERRGKPGWMVVGMLIPVVNFVVLGYLAFSD